MLAASVFFAPPQPARAQTLSDKAITSAVEAYRNGRVLTAQAGLLAALEGPDKISAADRARLLQTLLTLCARADMLQCLSEYAADYYDAVAQSPVGGQVQHERVREAIYFSQYFLFSATDGEQFRTLVEKNQLEWGFPGNASLYLRQRLLAAQVYVWADRPADALKQLDKALSLIAALKNPQDGRIELAWALSDAIGLLTQIGDVERAYGIYKASAPAIVAILPPRSVDAVRFHLVEAQLLERVGLASAADAALDRAIGSFDGLELEPGASETLAADLFVYKAVMSLFRGDLAGADAALARHPDAPLYQQPGRVPSAHREISYLAARALVAYARSAPDPIAAASLGGVRNADLSPEFAVYRTAGAALAAPAGPTRTSGLVDAGASLLASLEQRRSPAIGAWYRPGLIDQLIATLALAGASDPAVRSPGLDDTTFGLFQLVSRRGVTFDADAMAALSSAPDDGVRRLIHQALRLKARRDRAERAAIQAVARRSAEPATGSPLSYDLAQRGVYREFSDLLRQFGGSLGGRARTSGANLARLDDFQAVLTPDEAALAVIGGLGGRAAYLCVRRDRVSLSGAPADFDQLDLDVRLLRAALTAGHPPSDDLDAQYPVGAAVRLYDLLLRPFDDCLKPGDKAVWLPHLSSTPVPLASLLERGPPKLADGLGYDLTEADWFIKRHALSYAGSAAALIASRSQSVDGGDFDFLGVGDPILTGATPAGEDRGMILRRGRREGTLGDLPPLPETAEELRQSAAGFATTQVLTGAAATEANLRQQLIGSYRYLSFATHGLLRDDLQGLSDPALALTPVSAATSEDDGLFTASEIADLTLRARFVALSACNTANFDLTQASTDLPALASAFAVAGTPAALATLWPVDSGASVMVTAETFAGLKSGKRPSEALAEAQRAFLAAPPSRAHLHPRFWAPFVLLGDGGPAGARPTPDLVTRVEPVTQAEGEVLGLSRSGEKVAARFISDKDDGGIHGAGLRVAGPSGEAWRNDVRGQGATRVLIRLGKTLIAGGYAPFGDHSRAALELYDAASGRRLGEWTDPVDDNLHGFVMAGVALDRERVALAVVGLNFDAESDTPPRLRVLEVDARLSPRLLFEVALPPGIAPDKLTLAKTGGRLLLTYGELYPAGSWKRPEQEDDFDYVTCGPGPLSYAEWREVKDGRLVASARWEGIAAQVSIANSGTIDVAGQSRTACGQERRAGVWRVGSDLALRPVWRDEALGESWASALDALPDGRMMVGVLKRSVLDRQVDRAGAGWRYSAMLITLDNDGKAVASTMLDAGADVLVNTIDASDPKDILVGGALGDRATIFHLRDGG